MGERIVVSDFMGEKYEGDQDNRKRDLPCMRIIVHQYQLNINWMVSAKDWKYMFSFIHTEDLEYSFYKVYNKNVII